MESFFEEIIHLRNYLASHGLFAAGILLILGYFLGNLAHRVKLPEITGYIVAGIILGDAVSGLVHHEMSTALQVVTDVALGLIALTIGGEFHAAKLKRMGSEIMIITAAQILLTFAAVSAGLVLFRMPLPFAMLLGAIATATAPAATVAIVQSLRVRGPFVDRLYGIVALDDAGAVIIFGVVFAVVSNLLGAEGAVGSFEMIIGAFREILLSITMGAATGWIIHKLCVRHKHFGEQVIVTLGWIFLLTAISTALHLSPLLANMTAGAMLINLSPRNHRLFNNLEPLTPPIYALFFTIAGTELNPAVFASRGILLLGTVFIVARAFGKVVGVWGGAVLAKSNSNIKKYLGFCMLPQAGVAIGLVLMIQASPIIAQLEAQEKDIVFMMVNIILLSVFFNELTGPPISRTAIVKALDMEG